MSEIRALPMLMFLKKICYSVLTQACQAIDSSTIVARYHCQSTGAVVTRLRCFPVRAMVQVESPFSLAIINGGLADSYIRLAVSSSYLACTPPTADRMTLKLRRVLEVSRSRNFVAFQ
jgi:hypothetical protein